jgi:DNA repair protein RadC
VVLLDSRNCVTHQVMVYRGSINSVSFRPAEVLREAVRTNAPRLVVAHNHPSGDPQPSLADTTATAALIQAARLLGIEVLDHLVVGQGQWVSLRDQGVAFQEPPGTCWLPP